MYGLDLFSGIGGITKALEPWVQPVAYCEIEPYARAVLLQRMATGDLPVAPIWDDVTTLGKSLLPPIDIIYGGFPCQDISCAGRGAGLDGERSGLFFQIVRLIGELRPRFVFLENVAAITVRGSERVVGELCRVGYDCRWGVLSASDVGAPHRRDRWWLLAHANGLDLRNVGENAGNGQERQMPDVARSNGQDAGNVADAESQQREQPGISRSGWAGFTDDSQILADAGSFGLWGSDPGPGQPSRERPADALVGCRPNVADADGFGFLVRRRIGRNGRQSPEKIGSTAVAVSSNGPLADSNIVDGRGPDHAGSQSRYVEGFSGSRPWNDWWKSEPDVGRVADGIPARVDRLRGLGNAVVPQCAREAFKRLMGIK